MAKLLTVNQAAQFLNVSRDTLRRWDKAGKLTPGRTPSGYRVYSITDLKALQSKYLPVDKIIESGADTSSDYSLTGEFADFATVSTEVDKLIKIPLNISSDIKNDETSLWDGQVKPIFNIPSKPRLEVPASELPLFVVSTDTRHGFRFAVQVLAFLLLIPLLSFGGYNLVSKGINTLQKGSSNGQIVASITSAINRQNTSTDDPNISGKPAVLAEQTTNKHLELNLDTYIKGALAVTNPINQITLGGLTTISSVAPTTNRVATIPALTNDSTFLFEDQSQTITNKTISGTDNTITNITNSALANSGVTITTSGGLSGGGTVALGGTINIIGSSGSSGVTKLTGTSDQITVSATTGDITLSLPQSIGTASSPSFASLTTGNLTTTTALVSDSGGTSPVSSAILELRTTTKGFLASRVTTTQRDAIASPATGLLVFNTTSGEYQFYSGSSWSAVGSGGSLTVSQDGTTVTSPASGIDFTAAGFTVTNNSGTADIALANSGVTANTYGSASAIPVLAVDAKGRITSVTNTTISGLTTSNLSGSAGITNAQLANSSITINTAGPLGGGGAVALGASLSLTCATCLTSTGAVASLNSGTGTLTLNNAGTATGGTITINNALADGATKGIATFNATNFTSSTGLVNTIQDIATSSSPSFTNLTLSGVLASRAIFSDGSKQLTSTGTSAYLSNALSDETGTGFVVFSNSPTLATPVLGVATATSINGLTITTSTGTLTIPNGATFNSGSNNLTFVTTGSTTLTLPTSGTLLTSANAVTSLNTGTGALTLANAGTATGGTITINNALADGATKGIATFNATNFTSSTGLVNTIQDIASSSSPTFTNLTLSGVLASRALFADGSKQLTSTGTSAYLSAALSDETGTGFVVFSSSPTLVTPTLGAALATSINGLAITTSTGTLTIPNGMTFNAGTNNLTFITSGATSLTLPTSGTLVTTTNTVASLNTGTGALTLANAGTASSGTITINNGLADGATKGIVTFNATNFTSSTGLVNTIQDIASSSSPTFTNLTLSGVLASRAIFSDGSKQLTSTGTSAYLSNALSDETGTGFVVFSSSPTLVTPTLGAALATSINGLAITTSTGTLTIPNGITFNTGTNNLTFTTSGSTNVTLPTSGTLCTTATCLTSSSGVTTAQGTANQILVNGDTSTHFGAITLTLPQSIATSSDLVFNSVTAPTIIGGTAAGSSLTLQSTSGTGSTDYIKFAVGANGGTEAMRIIDNGNVGIGSTTPGYGLDVAQKTVAFNSAKDGTIGAWSTNANSIPVKHYRDSIISANGYLYSIGGSPDGSAAYSTVYYSKINSDGSTGTWNTTTFLASPRFGHTSVVSNGYLYVLGGYNGTVHQSTAYYSKINTDGTLGTWTTTAFLLEKKHNLSSITANGYLYVLGGYNGTTTTSTSYYAQVNPDGTLGTWATTAMLPTKRDQAAAFYGNGYVYLAGGNDSTNYNSTVYAAKLNTDGTLGAWAATTALPSLMYAEAAAVTNGYVYLSGGSSTNTASDTKSTVYYAKINSAGTIGAWTSTINIPGARYFNSSVVVNGYLYNIAGSDGTNMQSTVYYTPLARTSISGDLDLIGLTQNGGALNDAPGDVGGTIYAGNIYTNNNLDVQGNSQVWGSQSIDNNLSVQGTSQFNNNLTASMGNTNTALFTSSLLGGARSAAVVSITEDSVVANNSTGNLLSVLRSDVGSTTAAVSIQTTVTSGIALSITGMAGGHDIDIFTALSSGIGINMPSVTGGTGINFGSAISSGAGISMNTITTGAGITLSGLITSGTGMSITGGTAMTTGSLLTLGSSATKFVHTGSETGNASSITFSDESTLNGAITSTTNGLLISPTINATSGTGSRNINGITINPTTTACSSGTCSYASLNLGAITGAINGTGISIGALSSTGTNNYGINIANISGATNNYGINLAGPAASANNWAIYSNGTAQSYFNGNIGIGTTAPGSSLAVGSSSQFAVNSSGQITFNPSTTAPIANISNNVSAISAGSIGAFTTLTNSLPTKRYLDYQPLTANGYIYVTGGNDGAAAQSTVYYTQAKADGTTGSWATTAFLPTVVDRSANAISNGYLYTIGGTSGGTSIVYYAKQNSDGTLANWSTSSQSLPTNRYDVNGAAYNGYLFAVGGRDASNNKQSTVYFAKQNTDGSTGTWATTNFLPLRRQEAGTFAYNGYLYEIAGYENGTSRSTVYYAPINTDGTVGAWSTNANSLPAAVGDVAAFQYNGYVYISGGWTGAADTSAVYTAKVNSDGSLANWSTVTYLPEVRDSASSIGVNGFMYVMGGTTDGGTTIRSTVYSTPLQSTGLAINTASNFSNGNLLDIWNNSQSKASVDYNGNFQIAGSYNSNVVPAGDGSVGAWSAATFLPTAREYGATIVNNGYLYYAGGCNSNSSCTTSANIFSTIYYTKINTSTGVLGSWQTTANALPTNLSLVPMAAVNGYLYVMGGGNGSSYSAVYSAKANPDGTLAAFTLESTHLPQIFFNHAVTTYNSYLYVLGGNGTAQNRQSTVYYAQAKGDGTTSTWAATTFLPTIRSNLATAAANGYVFILGGINSGGSVMSTAWSAPVKTDGTLGNWTSITNFPDANGTQGTMIAYNNYLYVFGGTDNVPNQRSTVYSAPIKADGTIGSWSSLTSLPLAQGEGVLSAAYNGYVYVLGGQAASTTNSAVYSAPLNQSRAFVFNTLNSQPADSAPTIGGAANIFTLQNNSNTVFTVDSQGNGKFAGTLSASSIMIGNATVGDLAENMEVAESGLEAGDVVSVDGFGKLIKSLESYDTKVVGIISTNPSITLSPSLDNSKPVALSGRAPIKVSNENGPVVPGDYLTASSVPGVAMKATRPGQMVGKALESYDGNNAQTCTDSSYKCGEVLSLLNISYADPGNTLADLSLDTDGSLVIPKLKTNQLTLAGNVILPSSDASSSGALAFSQLTDLAQQVRDTQDHQSSLSTNLNSVSSQVAGIATDSGQLKTSVADLSTQVATQSGQIASNSAELASLRQRVDGLNLTPPDILLATGSANLASLNASDKISTLNLDASVATVSGQLNVFGDSHLSNTIVAGDIVQDGSLSITSGSAINAIGTLFLQSSTLAEAIDLFNGKVTISKEGVLAVQKLAVSSKTLGTAIIFAGQTEVIITTDQLTARSKVFTTSNLAVPVSVVKDIFGGKFTLRLPQIQSQDANVDWWIVDQTGP